MIIDFLRVGELIANALQLLENLGPGKAASNFIWFYKKERLEFVQGEVRSEPGITYIFTPRSFDEMNSLQ
jgi:hypothetical protein